MPTIRRTTVLAANATANPLQGSQYEYLPFNAMVEIAILAIADSVAPHCLRWREWQSQP